MLKLCTVSDLKIVKKKYLTTVFRSGWELKYLIAVFRSGWEGKYLTALFRSGWEEKSEE